MFKNYISKITVAIGKEGAATTVSKSIYIVCTGSDDIAHTYYFTPLRRPRYDISAYTDLMVEPASSFFQVNIDQLHFANVSAKKNKWFGAHSLPLL